MRWKVSQSSCGRDKDVDDADVADENSNDEVRHQSVQRSMLHGLGLHINRVGVPRRLRTRKNVFSLCFFFDGVLAAVEQCS